MMARSAPAVKEKLEDAEEEFTPNIIEKAKIVLPVVWPTLAVGAASTFCIVKANSINVKRNNALIRSNAALTSAYYISRDALKEYREKVVDEVGKKKEQKIRDDINQEKLDKEGPVKESQIVVTGNGDHLCVLIPFGTRFYSNIEKVKQAFLTINERMLNGNEQYITVNELYSELNIPRENWPGVGEDMGFNIDNGLAEVSFGSALAIMESGERRPCLTVDFDVVPV